jgi:hypothetical protein
VSNIIGEEDVTRRAIAARYRSGGSDQPANSSGVVEHEGKAYVALENLPSTGFATMGTLKRPCSWPADLI